ncbi:MAG: hypothetical protein ACR2MF_07810 [Chthoniobacterales bacterium]
MAVFLLTALRALAPHSNGQSAPPESAAVRVTVSMNPDGSRTAYEFDSANHKATATTTGKDQKVREKIHYLLDEGGRFASGKVFGADGKLRFKTLYNYDANGRLLQETQLGVNDVAQHKIVYSYDGSGKQTGYSVLDASGNLLSQTKAPSRAPVAKARER